MKMLPVNDLARTWCVEVAAGSFLTVSDAASLELIR